MKNNIDWLENELDHLQCIPQIDVDDSFTDDIVLKLGAKSLRKQVSGTSYTFPFLAALAVLCILTFTSVIVFLGSDNNYENYRNYYLKTVATFYSLDGSNNYQITN
jgi:hypothetical protein